MGACLTVTFTCQSLQAAVKEDGGQFCRLCKAAVYNLVQASEKIDQCWNIDFSRVQGQSAEFAGQMGCIGLYWLLNTHKYVMFVFQYFHTVLVCTHALAHHVSQGAHCPLSSISTKGRCSVGAVTERWQVNGCLFEIRILPCAVSLTLLRCPWDASILSGSLINSWAIPIFVYWLYWFVLTFKFTTIHNVSFQYLYHRISMYWYVLVRIDSYWLYISMY